MTRPSASGTFVFVAPFARRVTSIDRRIVAAGRRPCGLPSRFCVVVVRLLPLATSIEMVIFPVVSIFIMVMLIVTVVIGKIAPSLNTVDEKSGDIAKTLPKM